MESTKVSQNSEELSRDHSSVRVAWVMPTLARGFYWQPVFKIIAERFPGMKIFAGIWPGYLPGLEGSFKVEKFNAGKMMAKRWRKKRFIWTSPSLAWKLIRFRPSLIVTGGFHLGTMYLLALKPLLRWRVVLLWDGIGAEIIQLDNPIRLKLRAFMAKWFEFALSTTVDGANYLTDVVQMPRSRVGQYFYLVPDITALCANDTGRDVFRKEWRRNGPVFLYVGTLCREKGTHKLIECCKALVDKGITDFTCLLIGEGYMEEEVDRLREELGISQHLFRLGQIRYEELGAYYRESDVFLFPSLDDPLAMVVLEAMAFGKPILCSKYAGAKELVLDGENGFVFDPLDTQQIVDHMEKIIRNRDMIARLGARSLEIIKPYTPEASADTIIGVVNRALRDANPIPYDSPLPRIQDSPVAGDREQ